ncbi:gp53-like domain-containing protein [Escherichia sp. AP1362]|uniref:gp53-like domain-containing protein n=1 Tax=Escherichia sp. AP1362 TaxID=3381933 RepID=UPI00396F43C1
MLRIGQVEATATQDGKYTDGSVAGGIAATRLRAAAFNAMQEELAHIVESAGLALDINDMTQVLKAIQKLTLSRANPFADIKSDGAAAISTALTNLGLGEGAKLNAATATLGRTGFIAIPVMIGGIEQSVIIQWGWNAAKASASGGDGNTVIFPVAFNNACVAVVANYDNVSAPINAVATGGYTTTSFLLRCAAQTGSYYYNWIAIGY